jgi:hypothetical protein
MKHVLLPATLVAMCLLPALTAAGGAVNPTTRESGRITLHVTDLPLTQALTRVSFAAGITVQLNPRTFYDNNRSAEPKVTIDADDQPFWLVMRQISQQTNWSGLAGSTTTTPATVSLRQGSTLSDRPSCMADGFLIVADSMLREQVLTPGVDRITNRLETRLSLFVPPGTRLASMAGSATVLEARTPAGRTLAPPTPAVPQLNARAGQFVVTFVAPLQYTPNGGVVDKLAVLKGTIRVGIAGNPETWSIDNPLTAANVVRDYPTGEKMTIVRLTKNSATTYLMSMTLTASGQRAAGVADATVATALDEVARYHLLDGQQREFRGTLKVINATSRECSFVAPAAARAEPLPEPVKLVIDLPGATVEQDLPFEFKDLQLP